MRQTWGLGSTWAREATHLNGKIAGPDGLAVRIDAKPEAISACPPSPASSAAPAGPHPRAVGPRSRRTRGRTRGDREVEAEKPEPGEAQTVWPR